MSEQIEVGKWAIPFRGCAFCNRPFPGALRPFIVTEIILDSEDGVTECCGSLLPSEMTCAAGYWPDGDFIFVPLLRRLEDLSEEESIVRELETT